jgi:hypothetical protein
VFFELVHQNFFLQSFVLVVASTIEFNLNVGNKKVNNSNEPEIVVLFSARNAKNDKVNV